MKKRTLKVSRQYGSLEVEHTVTECDGETEIAIEMPLEPFIAAVLENVGNPFLIATRGALAKKIQASIDAEILRMKESTIYKAAETP